MASNEEKDLWGTSKTFKNVMNDELVQIAHYLLGVVSKIMENVTINGRLDELDIEKSTYRINLIDLATRILEKIDLKAQKPRDPYIFTASCLYAADWKMAKDLPRSKILDLSIIAESIGCSPEAINSHWTRLLRDIVSSDEIDHKKYMEESLKRVNKLWNDAIARTFPNLKDRDLKDSDILTRIKKENKRVQNILTKRKQPKKRVNYTQLFNSIFQVENIKDSKEVSNLYAKFKLAMRALNLIVLDLDLDLKVKEKTIKLFCRILIEIRHLKNKYVFLILATCLYLTVNESKTRCPINVNKIVESFKKFGYVITSQRLLNLSVWIRSNNREALNQYIEGSEITPNEEDDSWSGVIRSIFPSLTEGAKFQKKGKDIILKKTSKTEKIQKPKLKKRKSVKKSKKTVFTKKVKSTYKRLQKILISAIRILDLVVLDLKLDLKIKKKTINLYREILKDVPKIIFNRKNYVLASCLYLIAHDPVIAYPLNINTIVGSFNKFGHAITSRILRKIIVQIRSSYKNLINYENFSIEDHFPHIVSKLVKHPKIIARLGALQINKTTYKKNLIDLAGKILEKIDKKKLTGLHPYMFAASCIVAADWKISIGTSRTKIISYPIIAEVTGGTMATIINHWTSLLRDSVFPDLEDYKNYRKSRKRVEIMSIFPSMRTKIKKIQKLLIIQHEDYLPNLVSKIMGNSIVIGRLKVLKINKKIYRKNLLDLAKFILEKTALKTEKSYDPYILAGSCIYAADWKMSITTDRSRILSYSIISKAIGCSFGTVSKYWTNILRDVVQSDIMIYENYIRSRKGVDLIRIWRERKPLKSKIVIKKSEKIQNIKDYIQGLKKSNNIRQSNRIIVELIDNYFISRNSVKIYRYKEYIQKIKITFKIHLTAPPDILTELHKLIFNIYNVKGNLRISGSHNNIKYSRFRMVRLLKAIDHPLYLFFSKIKDFCKKFITKEISDEEIQLEIDTFQEDLIFLRSFFKCFRVYPKIEWSKVIGLSEKVSNLEPEFKLKMTSIKTEHWAKIFELIEEAITEKLKDTPEEGLYLTHIEEKVLIPAKKEGLLPISRANLRKALKLIREIGLLDPQYDNKLILAGNYRERYNLFLNKL